MLGLTGGLAGRWRGVGLESEFVGRRWRMGEVWGLGRIRLEYWQVESWPLQLGRGGRVG